MKKPKWKVRPMFAWYDFCVGWFWDKKKKILYIFPIPMFGIRIETKEIKESPIIHIDVTADGPKEYAGTYRKVED